MKGKKWTRTLSIVYRWMSIFSRYEVGPDTFLLNAFCFCIRPDYENVFVSLGKYVDESLFRKSEIRFMVFVEKTPGFCCYFVENFNFDVLVERKLRWKIMNTISSNLERKIVYFFSRYSYFSSDRYANWFVNWNNFCDSCHRWIENYTLKETFFLEFHRKPRERPCKWSSYIFLPKRNSEREEDIKIEKNPRPSYLFI